MTDGDETPSAIQQMSRSLPAPGWGRERLARVAPDLVDSIGFSRAPKRFRSERLPPEVRAAFADLWDAVAAEVADEVKSSGIASLRTRRGRKTVWKRLERVLDQAQVVTVTLGHRYPLQTGPWGHRSGGSLGSGAVAVGEQMVVTVSVVSGPSIALMVALTSAAMTELLEVYFVTSARMERYRHAARNPSVATIAADVGSVYSNGAVAPRSADRRIVEEAMRVLLGSVIARSKWRFAETAVLGVGPAVAGGMTGAAIIRAQRPALREPDVIERAQSARAPQPNG